MKASLLHSDGALVFVSSPDLLTGTRYLAGDRAAHHRGLVLTTQLCTGLHMPASPGQRWSRPSLERRRQLAVPLTVPSRTPRASSDVQMPQDADSEVVAGRRIRSATTRWCFCHDTSSWSRRHSRRILPFQSTSTGPMQLWRYWGKPQNPRDQRLIDVD